MPFLSTSEQRSTHMCCAEQVPNMIRVSWPMKACGCCAFDQHRSSHFHATKLKTPRRAGPGCPAASAHRQFKAQQENART